CLSPGHGGYLRYLLRAGRLQRDGQHHRADALCQAGAAQVRSGHRPAYPVESAAHVPPPRCAREADGVMVRIEDFYEAASRSGLLVDAEIDGNTIAVDFRSPDESVLDGL